MTLGEKIRQLRIQQNLSQGDLSDQLDVSRQSVSKWENDLAVPDLDKLVALADLFSVSLDALVRDSATIEEATTQTETAQPQSAESPEMREAAPQPPAETKSRAPHAMAGAVLLCTGAVIFCLMVFWGGGWMSILFALPFLLCGMICLRSRAHTGLWCDWAIYFSVDLYLSICTGSSRGVALSPYSYTADQNPAIIVISWLLLLALLALIAATCVTFGRRAVSWGQRETRSAAVCGLGLVLMIVCSHLLSGLLLNRINESKSYPRALWSVYSIQSFAFEWAKIALFTAFVVYIIIWFRVRRRNGNEGNAAF